MHHPPQPSASTSTPAPARASAHLRVAGPGPSTPAPSTPSNPPLTLKLAFKPPAPPIAGPSYTSASTTPAPPSAQSTSYDDTPKERKRPREELSPGTERLKAERKKEKKARDRAEKEAKKLADKQAAAAVADDYVAPPPGIPDAESGWLSGDLVRRVFEVAAPRAASKLTLLFLVQGPNPIAVYLDIIQHLRDHTDAL